MRLVPTGCIGDDHGMHAWHHGSTSTACWRSVVAATLAVALATTVASARADATDVDGAVGSDAPHAAYTATPFNPRPSTSAGQGQPLLGHTAPPPLMLDLRHRTVIGPHWRAMGRIYYLPGPPSASRSSAAGLAGGTAQGVQWSVRDPVSVAGHDIGFDASIAQSAEASPVDSIDAFDDDEAQGLRNSLVVGDDWRVDARTRAHVSVKGERLEGGERRLGTQARVDIGRTPAQRTKVAYRRQVIEGRDARVREGVSASTVLRTYDATSLRATAWHRSQRAAGSRATTRRASGVELSTQTALSGGMQLRTTAGSTQRRDGGTAQATTTQDTRMQLAVTVPAHHVVASFERHREAMREGTERLGHALDRFALTRGLGRALEWSLSWRTVRRVPASGSTANAPAPGAELRLKLDF